MAAAHVLAKGTAEYKSHIPHGVVGEDANQHSLSIDNTTTEKCHESYHSAFTLGVRFRSGVCGS